MFRIFLKNTKKQLKSGFPSDWTRGARRGARRGKILAVKAFFVLFFLYFCSANSDGGARADKNNAFWPQKDTCPKRLFFLHQK